MVNSPGTTGVPILSLVGRQSVVAIMNKAALYQFATSFLSTNSNNKMLMTLVLKKVIPKEKRDPLLLLSFQLYCGRHRLRHDMGGGRRCTLLFTKWRIHVSYYTHKTFLIGCQHAVKELYFTPEQLGSISSTYYKCGTTSEEDSSGKRRIVTWYCVPLKLLDCVRIMMPSIQLTR
jgi:hypothetical protein